MNKLVGTECFIMTIYLNKKKVYTKAEDEKVVLYNYVTNILLDRIFSNKIISITNNVEIVDSREKQINI